jgi:TatD DNase family protein
MPDPSLVDYHCHLDLYSDPDEVFRECIEKKISVLAVTTTPAAWTRNIELSRGTPSVRVALGFHPQVIAERVGEFSLFEQYLCDAAFVGEVGLDASPRFYSSFQLQVETFERIVGLCAAAGRKVLSIHSVRATAKVLHIVSEHTVQKRIAVVLHWFSGNKAEAKRALALGCYFSINHQMLRSPAGRGIAVSLPIDRILTETDGPFTRIDERPARPTDVEITLRHLADLRGINIDDVRQSVAANAQCLDEYARSLPSGIASEQQA